MDVMTHFPDYVFKNKTHKNTSAEKNLWIKMNSIDFHCCHTWVIISSIPMLELLHLK